MKPPCCMGKAARDYCTCTESKTTRDLRAALIRLLWNAVADDESCSGDCEDDGSPFPVCAAMRALGWGKHFSARKFQRRARADKEPR